MNASIVPGGRDVRAFRVIRLIAVTHQHTRGTKGLFTTR